MRSTVLYPLKFTPILKERLWGGSKLNTRLGKPISSDQTGESWELSGVKGDVSKISNGPLKGKNLQQIIDQYPEELLGNRIMERFDREFPILIKFIDASKDLSIQLHPDDKLARERHNSFGKTEMWYIMDADPGSELIIGFNKDVNSAEYKASLENGTLTELMNYVPVKEGDTFFINTGKVHAIGAGILLAEIQQTSDVTYRIYDFDRRDKDGNLRELHTELALDAIDYTVKNDFAVSYSTEPDIPNNMVQSPYFKTNYLRLSADKQMDLSANDSFTIYLCVKGNMQIEYQQTTESLDTGETILIPASVDSLTFKTQDATLLEVTI